jgi:hypothetical protein
MCDACRKKIDREEAAAEMPMKPGKSLTLTVKGLAKQLELLDKQKVLIKNRVPILENLMYGSGLSQTFQQAFIAELTNHVDMDKETVSVHPGSSHARADGKVRVVERPGS